MDQDWTDDAEQPLFFRPQALIKPVLGLGKIRFQPLLGNIFEAKFHSLSLRSGVKFYYIQSQFFVKENKESKDAYRFMRV
jgi:hypothetical protein